MSPIQCFSPYVAELSAKALSGMANADEIDALIRNVAMEARQQYAAELLRTSGCEEAAIAELQRAPEPTRLA